jgi:hypothetical protein
MKMYAGSRISWVWQELQPSIFKESMPQPAYVSASVVM